MKRVLSLVLALVMVLGMIPTFAAEMTGGEHLLDHGFITGKPGDDVATKLDAGAALTRQELAALIAELMGEKEIAAVFAQPADYADADKIGAWAVPFVAYAQVNGWMSGKPGNMFDPTGPVPGQQLAAVLMNALGYTVDTEAKYATVIADAAALGLVVPSGNLTRGQAFESMWVAVSEVNVNGEEQTLGVKLGKLDPPAPVVTDLAVDSVVADNLKAMTVVFNKEVDEDTVVAANFKVVKGTTTLTSAPTLLADGKTVVVVLSNPLTQSDSVKVTIEKVEDLDGKEIVKFEQTLVVNDVTVPTVKSVVALNPKQLEVVFSEPVNFENPLFTLLTNIKIDGASAVARTAVDYVDNTMLITLSNALAEGTREIEISAIKDFANFTAPTAKLSFVVVKDETAPVAVEAVVKSKTEVVVKFNEPVETPGQFRVDGGTAFTPASDDWNAQKTEVTLKGLNLGVAAIVEVKVEYKGQKDIMGNEVKDWNSVMTKVVDDTTLPTVELTSVTAGNKLTFTFSKSMAAGGDAKVEILNNKGNVIQTIAITAYKTGSDNKVLEVTPSSLNNVNPDDYSAKLSGLKDSSIRGNAMPTTTLAFKALDTKRPTAEAYYLAKQGKDADNTVNTDKDSVTIYFSEAMDVATIENLANYFVNNISLVADNNAVSAKASSDAKSVVITYKGSYAANLSFTVFSVKDAAGNVLINLNDSNNGQVVTKQNNTELTYSSAKAIDRNTIEVTFSAPIASVDPSLIVLHNGVEVVNNFVSATVKATDSKVVVFKTATAMATTTATYQLRIATPTSIKNVYGVGLTSDGTNAYAAGNTMTAAGTLVDNIKPELVSVSTYKISDVAQTGKFVMKFTEAVTVAGSLADLKTDLIVRYPNGTAVAAADYTLTVGPTAAEIIVTLTNITTNLSTGNNTVTVQLFAERVLEDASGNSNFAKAFDATSVTVVK